jgi:hypothetical protein
MPLELLVDLVFEQQSAAKGAEGKNRKNRRVGGMVRG